MFCNLFYPMIYTQLETMSRRLERVLYGRAESMEEYRDPATIKGS